MSSSKIPLVPAEAAINEVKNESNLVKEIDDDDDFEEFETSETKNLNTEENVEAQEGINVWEDNWDDDESSETDFSKQLREELAKNGHVPKF